MLGKGGEEDIVPVEDSVVAAIQDWVAAHELPWVFPGRGDSHLRPIAMQAAIRDLMVAEGLQEIRLARGAPEEAAEKIYEPLQTSWKLTLGLPGTGISCRIGSQSLSVTSNNELRMPAPAT